MPRRTGAPAITERALNRATLARQSLLTRRKTDAAAMLRHLIGMQGQVHNAPYVGLWSRIEGFRAADLEALLADRRAVRATLMRVTLHVAMAEDFLSIRPLVQAIAARGFRANHLKPLGGADPDEVRAAGRLLLDRDALSPAALASHLSARWPGPKPIDLTMPVRFLEPLVHVPPAGLFGATGAPRLTTAGRWLGREPEEPIDLESLMLRYLAAFGPATGADFNAWSGLSGGATILERLRPRLVAFSGDDGRELFDLPKAPRPEEDVDAPVRLLPDYDNVILGYADRRRMLSPGAFAGLWQANGLRPAFTVDGFVRGSWKLKIGKAVAAVQFTRFGALRRKDEAALAREARALLATLLPDRQAEVGFAD